MLNLIYGSDFTIIRLDSAFCRKITKKNRTYDLTGYPDVLCFYGKVLKDDVSYSILSSRIPDDIRFSK